MCHKQIFYALLMFLQHEMEEFAICLRCINYLCKKIISKTILSIYTTKFSSQCSLKCNVLKILCIFIFIIIFFWMKKKIKCFCFIKIIWTNCKKYKYEIKKTQTERISLNFICLVPSTNILRSVDYHAWGNIYHLLKRIYSYKKQYLKNILKLSFLN